MKEFLVAIALIGLLAGGTGLAACLETGIRLILSLLN